MNDISIIIPAHNSAQQLEAQLSKIIDQLPHSQLELVVVDQDSTGNISQVIAKYATQGFIRHIKIDKNSHLSQAYNSGAARAQNKYLLFLSPDVEYPDSFFQQALQKKPDKNKGIIFRLEQGSRSPLLFQTSQKPLKELLANTKQPSAKDDIAGNVPNMLCRKDDFQGLKVFLHENSKRPETAFSDSGLNLKLEQTYQKQSTEHRTKYYQQSQLKYIKSQNKLIKSNIKINICIFSNLTSETIFKLTNKIANRALNHRITYQLSLFINDGSPETIDNVLKNADPVIDYIYFRPFEVSLFFWINQMLMRQECDYFIFINHDYNVNDQNILNWVNNLLYDENLPVLNIKTSESLNDQEYILGLAIDMSLVREGIGFFSPICAPYSIINYEIRILWYLKNKPEWKDLDIVEEPFVSNYPDNILADVVRESTKSMLEADNNQVYCHAVGNLGPFKCFPQHILPKNYEIFDKHVETAISSTPRWYYTFDSYLKRAGIQDSPKKNDLLFLPQNHQEKLAVLSLRKNNSKNNLNSVIKENDGILFVDLQPLTLNQNIDISYLQSSGRIPIIPTLPLVQRKKVNNAKYYDGTYSAKGKASILISGYNNQNILFYSLYSILQQSYDNIELVFVDDSLDANTIRYASALLELFPYVSKKIIYLPKHVESLSTLDVALLESSGDYITRQNFNDFSTSQRIFLSLLFINDYKSETVYLKQASLNLNCNYNNIYEQNRNNSFNLEIFDQTLFCPRRLISDIISFCSVQNKNDLTDIEKLNKYQIKSSYKFIDITCYYSLMDKNKNRNEKQPYFKSIYRSQDMVNNCQKLKNKNYLSFDSNAKDINVICNIATIPSRQKQFLQAFNSICYQVDFINIVLNNFNKIPDQFQDLFSEHSSKCRIIRSQDIGDMRDNAKFYYLNERDKNTYYLTVDDDIIYPYDYVDRLMYKSNLYNDQFALCVHGYCLWENIDSVHNDLERRSRYYNFKEHLDYDILVDIPGTGTLFLPPKVNIGSIDNHPTGMADIIIADKLRKLEIPIICISRPNQWLKKICVNVDESLFVENKDVTKESIIHSYLPALNERVCFQGYNQKAYKIFKTTYQDSLQQYYSPLADVNLNILCGKPVYLCCTGYNYEKYAYKFIKSLWNTLRATNYHNTSVLIFDDCSDDDSLHEILKYINKYLLHWPVSVFKSNKNLGPAFGRAFLLEQIKSNESICIFLDLDDQVKPGLLRRIIAEYAFNPETLCTFGSWYFNDIIRRPWPTHAQNELHSLSKLFGQFKLSSPRTFTKKNFVNAKKDLLLDPDDGWLKYCSDLALILSIISPNNIYKFRRVNEILYGYNLKTDNNTIAKYGEAKRIIRDYLYTKFNIMISYSNINDDYSKKYQYLFKRDSKHVQEIQIQTSSNQLPTNQHITYPGTKSICKENKCSNSKLRYVFSKNKTNKTDDIKNIKSAEKQVNKLKTKMLTFGFTEKAYSDLLELSRLDTNEHSKRFASRELAIWHANQYTKEDAVKSLDMLALAKENEHDYVTVRQNAILEAECLETLGLKKKARKVIDQALKREPHEDLYFAASNLESKVQDKIELINKALALHGLSPIVCNVAEGKAPFDSLKPALGNSQKEPQTSTHFKVTVIIPAYNAQDTISVALNSILAQTWSNLEVLVVDDCSTDNTVNVVKSYCQKDARVSLIKAKDNQGPYVARNLALRKATGEYVTINDADDWSHPEKIEIQVRHLWENHEVMANTSELSRSYADLRFFRRGQPGFYSQLNMSSLMFRREKIIKTIGYWDSVRFGADGEFKRRIKKSFGEKSVVDVKTGPLSFIKQSAASLTGNKYYGYFGYLMGARKEYFESFNHYYQKVASVYFEFPQKKRLFPAPEPMWPIRAKKTFNKRKFDVVIASDFSLPGGTTASNVEEIRAQKKKCLYTGLVHMPRYDLDPNRIINPKIRNLIDGDLVQMLVYGEEISCDLLIVRHPPVLQIWRKYLPYITAKDIRIIINQTPRSNYGVNGKSLYDVKACSRNLKEYFGRTGIWHPIGPLARQALHDNHSEDLKEIKLADNDWHNILDISDWRRPQRPTRRDNKVIIGRHSRSDKFKWPDKSEDIIKIYPESKEFEVRILGGAEAPKNVLGYLPRNWRVYEFGSMHPKDFLSDLDVFVYYTHPDSVEAFGRVILEAMAVGVPVILPHEYVTVFNDAAMYSKPDEVIQKISQLMQDNEIYKKQVNIAYQFVEQNFSYCTHEDRLKKILKSNKGLS